MDVSNEQVPGLEGSESKTAVKRSLPKTPLQKETLEAAFNVNQFPSEEYRRALGERIELTEQQVQAWFINRRRRDKKPEGVPPLVSEAAATVESAPALLPTQAPAPALPPKKSSAKKPSAPRVPSLATVGNGSSASYLLQPDHASYAVAAVPSDLQELIDFAATTIEGYCTDGPELGYFFDEPPVAAGVSAHTSKRKMIVFDGYVAEADEMGVRRHDLSEVEHTDERFSKFERERAREEAKRLKEAEKVRLAQEKEQKRLELQKEKERKAEEKKKAIEDKKREKEMAKAMAHQDKQLSRVRHHHGSGPPDDLDLEWECLIAAAGFSESDQVTEVGLDTTSATPVGTPGPGPALTRPAFPPTSLSLQPAFPFEVGDELGGEMLMIWNFMYSFSDILGIPTPAFDDLMHSIMEGGLTGAVPLLHISLLRIVQADMEEAYAAGASTTVGPGTSLDRALAFYGGMLEEAWGWGFDVDSWRAHLNAVTWPEILRQVAIMAGAGPKRVKPQRGGKPKVGVEGEDVAYSESGEIYLRMPTRFGVGTMKAAAWLVLSESGPAGLTVSDIAHQMQKKGLRDLKSTKTPEASIAGAMSRDAVFVRVAPSTFALQTVITHQRKILGKQALTPLQKDLPADILTSQGETEAGRGHPSNNGQHNTNGIKQEEGAVHATPNEGQRSGATPVPSKEGNHAEEEGEYSDSGDEDDEDGGGDGSRHDRIPQWMQQLMYEEYSTLDVGDKLAALSFLISIVLNGPTVRAKLDEREEQAAKLKKMLLEEAKNEKKKKASAPPLGGKAPTVITEKAAPDEGPSGEGGPSIELPPGKDIEGSADVVMTEAVSAEQTVTAGIETEGGAAVAASSAEGGHTVATAPLSSSEPVTDGHATPSLQAEEEEEEDCKKASQGIDALRKVDEENRLRMEPLGLDRRHNRYWRFVPLKHNPSDLNTGRIFIEDSRNGSWKLIHTLEQYVQLKAALDPRGVREMELAAELERLKDVLTQSMPAPPLTLSLSSDFGVGSSEAASSSALSAVKLQAERFLPISWSEEAPGQEDGSVLNVLRKQLKDLEAALPPSAVIVGGLDREDWLYRLHHASSPRQLRSCLGELEALLVPGFLAKEFVRIPRVVDRIFVSEDAALGMNPPSHHGAEAQPTSAASLSPQLTGQTTVPEYLYWLPPTCAALSLRLATLDASLLFDPSSGCTGRDQITGYRYMLRPPVARPHQLPRAATLPAVSASISMPVLAFGRIRPLKLIPDLPAVALAKGYFEFSMPDVESQRKSVSQAALTGGVKGEVSETWRLRPALAVRLGLTTVKVKGGGPGKSTAGVGVITGITITTKGKGTTKSTIKPSKNKKKTREVDSDSDKDYGEGYDDGLDNIIVDGPKYEYNAAGQGTSDPRKSKKKKTGPGELYMDLEMDEQVH